MGAATRPRSAPGPRSTSLARFDSRSVKAAGVLDTVHPNLVSEFSSPQREDLNTAALRGSQAALAKRPHSATLGRPLIREGSAVETPPTAASEAGSLSMPIGFSLDPT